MGNYHARFWRRVISVTGLLSLIDRRHRLRFKMLNDNSQILQILRLPRSNFPHTVGSTVVCRRNRRIATRSSHGDLHQKTAA